ncbi:MAG: hypothetical protein R3D30_10855 [Hyphomicrobiales bacterium]
MTQYPAAIDLGALTGSAGANPGFRLDGIDAGDLSGQSVAWPVTLTATASTI